MSTASKYRVDLTPSRWRNYQWLIPVLAIWLIVHSLSDETYSWVPMEYFSLLACGLSGLFYWRQRHEPLMLSETYLLGDDGSWQQTLLANTPIEGSRELIGNHSRVTPVAVFVSFSTQKKSRWVIKGECNEQAYRRLCRIVLQRNNADLDGQ